MIHRGRLMFGVIRVPPMAAILGTVLPALLLVPLARAGGPKPPPGYPSLDAVKAAFLLGKVKPIDRHLAVPDSVLVTRGLVYGKGGGKDLKLDLYAPKKLNRPTPGLIFIHGGAWKKGSRDDYHYYCVRFAERGYVVATITYRLTQEAPFPAAVEDAKCAVRWLRANARKLHVDPAKIGVVGGSAGGHLALMVGCSSDVRELEGDGGHPDTSSRVQAVVDLYGPVDLTTPFATGNKVVIDFLGRQTYAQARKQYELASPIFHVTADDPPTLILHGTIDKTVPVAQSDALAAKLKATGIPYRYVRLEGWPHTMDVVQVVNDYCMTVMTEFFDKYLPLPK